MSKRIIIAVDFDGTIVEHRFPEIGLAVPGAFGWMQTFQSLGAKLILWTMRSDHRSEIHSPEGHKADRSYLDEAIQFCRGNGVEFWSHNENPEQGSWTKSPKAYAQIYIDDAAFGCPLVYPDTGVRPYVDWSKVGPMVAEILRGLES